MSSWFFLNSCNRQTLPNVIFITVDALRADHLGVYGYKYKTSPNIDKLAEKSIVFQFAYCPIPKTSASFASIMTGLHPFIHKTKPNLGVLKKNFMTLAEAFEKRGYYTYAIVDNANLSKKFFFNQGFDKYEEVWTKIKRKTESTGFITKKALSFLNQSNKKPFFLWLHYIEPHTPYIPPKKYFNKFLKLIPRGRNIKEISKKVVVGTKYERDLVKIHPYEGYFVALYDAAVNYVDSKIGEILKLFYRKFSKDTILIFSADHGEDLGDYNFYFDHGPLTFNSASRIPLIIYLPEKKHKVIKTPVSNMDIYPTLLSIIKVKPNRKIDGKSLFWRKRKSRLLYICGLKSSSMVTEKGGHFSVVSPQLADELGIEKRYFFNIFKDPLEQKNIIEKHAALAKVLDKKYYLYFKKHQYFKFRKNVKKRKLSKKDLKSLKTLGYVN